MDDMYKNLTVWVMTSVSLLSVVAVCLCLCFFWCRNRKRSNSPCGGRLCCCTQPESVVIEVQSSDKHDMVEDESLMRANHPSQDHHQFSSLEKTVPELLCDVANSIESLVLQLSLLTKQCLPLVLSKDVVHDLLMAMKGAATRLQDIRGLLEDKEVSLSTRWAAADTTRIAQYLQRIRKSAEAQGMQQLLLKLPQGDNSDCSTAPSLELGVTSVHEVTSRLDSNLQKQLPLVDNNLRKHSSKFNNNFPARPTVFDESQSKQSSLLDNNQLKQSLLDNNQLNQSSLLDSNQLKQSPLLDSNQLKQSSLLDNNQLNQSSLLDSNQLKQSSLLDHNVPKHSSGTDDKVPKHSSVLENNLAKQFSGPISGCGFRDATLTSHMKMDPEGKSEVEDTVATSQNGDIARRRLDSPENIAEPRLSSGQKLDDKRIHNRALAMEELSSRLARKETFSTSAHREHADQSNPARPAPPFAFLVRPRGLGPKLQGASYILEKTTHVTANCGQKLVATPNSQSQIPPLQATTTTQSWLSRPLPFPSVQGRSLRRMIKHSEQRCCYSQTDVDSFTSEEADLMRKRRKEDSLPISSRYNHRSPTSQCPVTELPSVRKERESLVQKVPRITINPACYLDGVWDAQRVGSCSGSCQRNRSEIQWRPGEAAKNLRRNRVVNLSVLGKWWRIGDRLQTVDGVRAPCGDPQDCSHPPCQHVTEGNISGRSRSSQAHAAFTCARNEDCDNMPDILRRKKEEDESADENKKTANKLSDCSSAGIKLGVWTCDRSSQRKQKTDCSLRLSSSEMLQRKRGLMWERHSKLQDNVFEVSACRSEGSLEASTNDLKESTDTNVHSSESAGEPGVDNKRKSSTVTSFLQEASLQKGDFPSELIQTSGSRSRADCTRNRLAPQYSSHPEQDTDFCRPLSDIVDASFMSRAYDRSRSYVSDNTDLHLSVFSTAVTEDGGSGTGDTEQESLNEGFLTESKSYNRSISVPHLWRPFASPPRFSQVLKVPGTEISSDISLG